MDASVAFLELAHDSFPMKVTTNGLLDLLYKTELWTKAIFDYAVGSISKYNIKSFYL